MSQSASTMVETTQPTFEDMPLPSGWQWVQLKEVCERIDYGFTASADFTISEPRFLRITDIQNRRVDWEKVPACKISAKEEEANKLADGDIVFARTGGTTGKSFLIRNPPRAVFASYLIRLRPTDDVDGDFLYSFFQSDDYWKQIRASARGGAQPNVNATLLGNLYFPLPPFPEQKRIGAILNEQMAAVERARAAAEAQLKAAKSLYYSYLRFVFDSDEAQRWEKKRLGDISIVGPDNGAFKKRHEFGAGVPIVNVLDLFRSLKLDLHKVERVNASLGEQSRYAIASGDLFFCRSSLKREGVGWCCYVEEVNEPAIFECHVMRVRLDPESALPDFVAHYWRHPSVREEVISSAKTATMTTMNQGDLARVAIPLPTINEQRRLAATLSEKLKETERIVSVIQSQLSEINKLPATLLRQAFIGHL